MPDQLVGTHIQALRMGKKLTREALAEKADISAKFLYEIEKGKKSFSVDVLRRIANGLDVCCDEIVYGKRQGDCEYSELIRRLERFGEVDIQEICIMMDALREVKKHQQTDE